MTENIVLSSMIIKMMHLKMFDNFVFQLTITIFLFLIDIDSMR
jgi:hypothetical protein